MFFQIIAVVVLLLFYGCYFIKMFTQKKKGIRTDHLGKGKKGTAMKIEVIVKITSVLVPLVEVSCIILNVTALPLSVRYAGVVIALLGDAIFILSVLTMRESWRAGVSEFEKTQLVTNGIYRFSRNPAFLGFELVYVGLLLMFFNWTLLTVTLFAVVMFHLQIVSVEEKYLIRTFGKEYINYCAHVHRYFGRRK